VGPVQHALALVVDESQLDPGAVGTGGRRRPHGEEPPQGLTALAHGDPHLPRRAFARSRLIGIARHTAHALALRTRLPERVVDVDDLATGDVDGDDRM
jgi:hypothetical protein